SDPHLSEYVADCFKYREYFSGFDGSAGTLFITQKAAFLITDGRYFLQAEKQLESTGIDLVRSGMPGEPNLVDLCGQNLNGNDTVFVDPTLVSASFYEKLSTELSKHGISVCSESNPITEASHMPLQWFSEIVELDLSLCGISRKEKLGMIRSKMKEVGADGLILTSLDDVAWLFNLRGCDVENTPVFYSYGYVTQDNAFLFVDTQAAQGVLPSLETDDISVLKYNDFSEYISSINEKNVLVDKNTVNASVINSLPKDTTVIDAECPTQRLKAIKNKTEIDNMIKTHIYDGIALLRFMRYIKSSASDGVTEHGAARKLLEFRRECKEFNYNSFDTISAYAENAAIIHYSPSYESDKRIDRKGALLVDSGGQYNGGTTDVTRMFILGDTSPEFRRNYTLVCKAMLKLQNMHFPLGTKSAVLDGIVRETLWKYSIDFRHGTGHGIGYMLSVHEGPVRISYKDTVTEFVPGMVTSDEPGYYEDGKYGIRMENALLCVDAGETEYGKFCKFEPLTLCPIDIDGLDLSLLTSEDVDNVNKYHELVRNKLLPYLSLEDAEYLKIATRQI
ncbi:MAG: aminopeptidase P family protein, partial [Clostridia bacterium]|nr:aminopeptidase P family protein [Clostridia bacterium]